MERFIAISISLFVVDLLICSWFNFLHYECLEICPILLDFPIYWNNIFQRCSNNPLIFVGVRYVSFSISNFIKLVLSSDSFGSRFSNFIYLFKESTLCFLLQRERERENKNRLAGWPQT